MPRMYVNPDFSYIIVGGLGGFGIEMTDWLVMRGCRKVVLSSRKGITLPHQQFRIRYALLLLGIMIQFSIFFFFYSQWKSYGVTVEICTADIITYKGCCELIKAAEKIGPVGGILNLAAILNDKIFENQTVQAFKETMSVKANATKYLDKISRIQCPHLKIFLVFSSLSCGRGNPGQTNYGMGNSVMERIVESRVAAGYPGKAIQWGAIGDVGLLTGDANNNAKEEIGGTIKQKIWSCVKVMDQLISSPDPIVASMIVAKKKKRNMHGGIMEYLKNAFNLKSMTTAYLNQTFFEIGIDSLMTMEILQVLERDYDLSIPIESLRTLTIQDIVNKIQKTSVILQTLNGDTLPELEAVDLFLTKLRSLSDEVVLHMTTKKDDSEQVKLLVPGIHGICNEIMQELGHRLNCKAFCLQYEKMLDPKNIQDITEFVLKEVKEKVIKDSKKFYIIGHSYGGLLALDLAARLEDLGLNGKVVLIDSSPATIKKRTQATLKIRSKAHFNKQSEYGVINRLKTALELDVNSFVQLKSDILLFRSTSDKDLDYELDQHTSGNVSTVYLNGDHFTMLRSNGLDEMVAKIEEYDKSEEIDSLETNGYHNGNGTNNV